MITRLTWAPNDGPAETLTADIPENLLTQMLDKIGTTEWVMTDAVMWINCRAGSEPMTKRLFRLARITALEPQR